MDELAVGIDIGTTSVKGVAVSADGGVVARARLVHGAGIPSAGRLEHDADVAWRQGPQRVLAELMRPGVRAVAVAAMVPSLTAVGAAGEPRTPGLLYGDERGRSVDPDAKSGTGGEAIGFLAWTAGQAPDARGYWPAQAVANHALAGLAVMDNASAAACYPLFDGTAWSAAQLAALGIEQSRMPDVVGLGQAAGEVGDAVLASGLVDAIGEQVVSGAVDDGDVLVICGSTLITWVVVDSWREVDGLLCIPHSTPGKFLLGGPSNAGGLFLDWVRRLVGAQDTEPPADPTGLPVWEPYPRGERTPLDDPHRRASLAGLDLTHGPSAVLRAAHEASGFVVRRIVDRAGVTPRRLVATGGGVRDDAWLQALADCTRLPTDVVDGPEGAARGAAFVGRIAAGLETDLAEAVRWARIGATVEPREPWAEAADERYVRFGDLAG